MISLNIIQVNSSRERKVGRVAQVIGHSSLTFLNFHADGTATLILGAQERVSWTRTPLGMATVRVR